jgi:hypothetical protein
MAGQPGCLPHPMGRGGGINKGGKGLSVGEVLTS